MKLVFVTGNKGKALEARAALAPLGVEVEARDLRPVEIQGETLEEIARAKCEALVGKVEGPFIVDDGGLFVHALNMFPGPYSAFTLKTLGVHGILKLMEGVEDRRAHFAAVVGFHDGARVHLFAGRCDGRLATAPRSEGHGFGFDPVFIPEGHQRTFGELPAQAKNELSHRGRALAGLAGHLRRK